MELGLVVCILTTIILIAPFFAFAVWTYLYWAWDKICAWDDERKSRRPKCKDMP